ncbi:hypothetical protein NLX62_03175 [Mycobacteriaceae bacterium Msp059]|nr:hypothetical protein [Mycobacteriaceae bacterium Msp059]
MTSRSTDPLRDLIARAAVVALHSHTVDEPCDDTCSVYERPRDDADD